jgi:hypothetical protein
MQQSKTSPGLADDVLKKSSMQTFEAAKARQREGLLR